ncbi:MAG: DNA-directed RNA polymerase subunit L, partial [Candidatus Caldarchaeum sp.]
REFIGLRQMREQREAKDSVKIRQHGIAKTVGWCGKMKMKIIEETQDFMSIEVVDEDQSIINLFAETLNNVDGVLYAGYRVEHPLTGKMTISIKVDPSKTSPRKALQEGLKEIRRLVEAIDQKLDVLR